MKIINHWPIFKINFQKLQSVTNPNSIHGIYPYRGKISAVDTANVIQQFSKNKILLDPFCGTGTIVFEGYRHGLNVIGVDRNPLAIIVTKGKLSLENTTESSILKETGTIVEKSKKIIKNSLFIQNISKKEDQTHLL